MAKKRKKQVNQYRQQKIAEAQYKKVFRKKLKFLLDAIDCSDLFYLIPKHDYDLLFYTRMRGLKVLPANDCDMPLAILKLIEKQINSNISNRKIKIMGTGPEIGYQDLDTLGTALKTTYCRGDEEAIIKGVNFTWRLNDFIKWFKSGNTIFDMLYDEALIWCKTMSCLLDGILWYSIRMSEPDEYPIPRVIIEYHYTKTDRKTVRINLKRRTVYEVAWAEMDTGYRGATFKPKPEEYSKLGDKESLKVYIQAHALNRIVERLGDKLMGIVHVVDVFNTIMQSNKYHYENGKFYFDFLLLGVHKVGYLVGEITNNVLVIRTFLFLTNNGTPEGRKLHELTGFNKADKKYLGIDKLSAFQNSDIEQNEKVKQLFIDAGCESLFNIKINLSPEESYQNNIAETMLNYLNTYQKEPENIEELEHMMNEELQTLEPAN